jgi:hypothetical protein
VPKFSTKISIFLKKSRFSVKDPFKCSFAINDLLFSTTYGTDVKISYKRLLKSDLKIKLFCFAIKCLAIKLKKKIKI